ncbi:MAG TPA: TRCF domain-containing protein, partial [Desulfopila sp.]|nr:TRCF domain-containing protein [Desulfopila sp.]
DDDLDPEINLQISAYIPESYIADISQRYIAYRRISSLSSADEAIFEDLKDELADRYGRLPWETQNLFAIVALKKSLCSLRISKLEKGKDTLVFTFVEDTPLHPGPLLEYIQKRAAKERKNPSRLLPDGRLVISTERHDNSDVVAICQKLLAELNTLTHE